MVDLISQYQYHLAWVIYLIFCGIFFLVILRFTRAILSSGWRSLIRGMSLVMVYTPWYISEAQDYIAPAFMVVVMELLLGHTENGLAASMALLLAMLLMLALLILKSLLRRKHDD